MAYVPAPPPPSRDINGGMRMHRYVPEGIPNIVYGGMKKSSQLIQADPSIPPSRTLYLNNLNDRIKIDEMKRRLNNLFKQYGEINHITALTSFWRRGQAWIVFKTTKQAQTALNQLQGYSLFGKPMRINFSLEESDYVKAENGEEISKRVGPVKPKRIRAREEKEREMADKMHQQFIKYMEVVQAGGDPASVGLPNLPFSSDGSTPVAPYQPDAGKLISGTLPADQLAATPPDFNSASMTGWKNRQPIPQYAEMGTPDTSAPEKRRKAHPGDFDTTSTPWNRFDSPPHTPPIPSAPVNPSKTLFVTELFENVTHDWVHSLFSPWPGFTEARVIPGRKVAFVDFDTEQNATAALKALQGQETYGSKLCIAYAR